MHYRHFPGVLVTRPDDLLIWRVREDDGAIVTFCLLREDYRVDGNVLTGLAYSTFWVPAEPRSTRFFLLRRRAELAFSARHLYDGPVETGYIDGVVGTMDRLLRGNTLLPGVLSGVMAGCDTALASTWTP
jgi:hypothetical protein